MGGGEREGHSVELTGRAFVILTPNVRIPDLPDSWPGFLSRVPDVVVSTHKPRDHFSLGGPPELVIEILATPRGNVDGAEKIDDCASRCRRILDRQSV